jgi:4-cresol dehydrogenase (hydroxylating)
VEGQRQVLRPRSVEDVVAIVRRARAERTPLYPVSRGMNWGYGGAEPVRPGCTVVDLSEMASIRNAGGIGESNPVALLEPGVTQAQLFDHLRRHAPTLGFNVTGSAADSSVLGNALDRGVGYGGPRVEDVHGLEVVLGTGEVLYTGFRRLGEQSPLAISHPYGIGPLPDGLFFQGNLGIVTSACFKLRRRRPVEHALFIGVRDASRLGEFVDRMIGLKRDRLLTSVAHIANVERSRATLSAGLGRYLEERCGLRGEALRRDLEPALRVVAGTPWTALASLDGNAAQVRASLAEVRARLRGLATVRIYGLGLLRAVAGAADALRGWTPARRVAAALSAVVPLQHLALGEPTDIAFQNLFWLHREFDRPAADYASSRCGILFVNPALPADGPFVQRVVAELGQVAAGQGQPLYVTVNIETAHTVVAVINLLYDRADEASRSAALRCSEAMHCRIRELGLELYRARTDQMADVTGQTPGHWALMDRLKQAWDPDRIIAPGRYGLP